MFGLASTQAHLLRARAAGRLGAGRRRVFRLRPFGGGVRAAVDFDVLAGGRYNSFLHRAIH
ncbi:hypothetical protein B7486_07090 [cyanobacterium TDX16]|nr:hypothetical protein B7486_07090 [cyanobacterium TDX16]